MRPSIRSAVSRRRLLATGASVATLTAASAIARPALSFAADRPTITHGVQSGDVSVDSAVVWARADRPSRMQVEISTTESFKMVAQGAYVDALPESDFTAKALVDGLPAAHTFSIASAFRTLPRPALSASP